MSYEVETEDVTELQSQNRGLKDEIETLKSRVKELQEENEELEERAEQAESLEPTHETPFGEIKATAHGLHEDQIMDALIDAYAHGRPLHLIEYLQAYKPDTHR